MHVFSNKKTIMLLAACFVFTSAQTSEQDNKDKSSSRLNSVLAGLNSSVGSANNYIAGFLLGTAQGALDGFADAKYDKSNVMRGGTHLITWYATGQAIQKMQPRKIMYTVTYNDNNGSFIWKMKASKQLGPNPAHGQMLVGRWTAQALASCVDFGQMRPKVPAFDMAAGVSAALQLYDYIAWKYAGNASVEEKIVINDNKA